MLYFLDPSGQTLGVVSQGVGQDPNTGRMIPIYWAQTYDGFEEACDRFACARRKIAERLAASRIAYQEVQA